MYQMTKKDIYLF